jgi:hypothetical protein
MLASLKRAVGELDNVEVGAFGRGLDDRRTSIGRALTGSDVVAEEV